jgi:hypothetical protein
MKKTIIFGALFFLLSAASAQHVHFGIKGGVNVAQLHFDNNTSSDSKVGLHAGVLVHIHTSSKSWAVQPELLYSMEGAQKIGNSSTKFNLNYLNVPVLVQYLFENGFRLEAGPQIGFLLDAKRKAGSVSVDDDGFKSTAFSIPAGLGYLTTSGLGFDARYVFGISNINDDDSPTVHSNVFQLGIFYQFTDTKKKHPHH